MISSGVLVLAMVTTPAQSQEWRQYLAFDDFFSISFPGEPTIRGTTYRTEYGIVLPAKTYTAEDFLGSYVVTVMDWAEAQELHDARFAACQASGSNACFNSWSSEISGAAAHAVADMITRPGTQVTYFGQYTADGVAGFQLELAKENGSRTTAVAHWHENRLYIVEATASEGMPDPEIFPVSFGFIDEDGRRIQYRGGRYFPLFPKPNRSR